jgi:trk system potassium uptake protein TrkA
MLKFQYIVIVGCGRLGSLLASTLSSQGSSVVIIDRNRSTFDTLSIDFSGFEIAGDAAELAVLREAKINRADCLLAVTGSDNLNLMVAQIAKSVFAVPTVLVRVFDPHREELYRDLGLETISPTKLAAEVFLQTLKQQTHAVELEL